MSDASGALPPALPTPLPLGGRFTVPADHPSLPGHFPGRPVVPGVVLLDAVFALAALRPTRLLRAKFAAPVGPDEAVEVAFTARGPNRLGFTCRCRGAVALSGEFEGAPA